MSRQRTIRQKRVADRIQIVIGELLQRRLTDPRLGLLTVTSVNVDRELELANVWVCAADYKDQRRAEVMTVLDNARGFIRRELASRVQMRRTPRLVFHWDFAPDHAARIDKLIDSWESPLSPPTPTGNSDDDAD